MQTTKIILGTYNTMPEACSDRLFESNYQRSWRPFLSSLYKFQNVSAVLYYSGTIFQWIEDHHPEFLLLLEEMALRKQIEILGGGYFSPLFPLLQPSDKIGQIEMLTTYLRKTFGRRPTGGWLYEYGWDPSLPFVFRNAGFGYSFLPQGKLVEAGLIQEGGFSPLLTEDQRKTLYIFPTYERRNVGEPPRTLESIVEGLRAAFPEEKLFSLMLDGQSLPAMWEASGLESPDVLFEKSFAWFQRNCLEIESVTAREWVKSLKAASLFYVSSCVSSRIDEASAKTRQKASGIASPVKQALLGDRAARHLYDKMCQVHNLTNLLRGDKARKKSAQEDLWKAQSGELYWESAFGGLRRPEIRLGAFRSLIEAEKTTRLHGNFSPGILLDDIDCDGVREILYQAADINCYIHEKGGSVFEIDSFKRKQELCAVFMPESENGVHSFVDAFYGYGSFDTVLHNLGGMNYSINEKEKGPQKISLLRDFPLRNGEELSNLSLRKSYIFQKHSISADIEIVNKSNHEVRFRFVSEMNLQPSASLEDLFFSAIRGRETEEVFLDMSSVHESFEALSIRTCQGKESIEFRSDKAFFFLLDHCLDRLDNRESSSGFVGGEGFDGSCGYTKDGKGEYRGEVLYQGTKMRFGWDVVLMPDMQTTCSLSLHLGN